MKPLLIRFGAPLFALFALYLAWSNYGWQGVAVVGSAIVMWGLLHVNRVMAVLKRAANRPVGYVDSAVMLNAKLASGVSLLHVVALTRALGVQKSAEGVQPELYRWTDNTQSYVECEFLQGRLVRWQMTRPDQPQSVPDAPGAPGGPPGPDAAAP